MARNYTALEAILIEFGFTELFGIGLFAISEDSVMADTNSGMVKLIPNVESPSDSFIDIYDEEDTQKLRAQLEELQNKDFIF